MTLRRASKKDFINLKGYEKMFKKAIKLLKEKDNILIIAHVRPDGDSLGSSFALKLALEAIGKSVIVACSSKVTKKYQIITHLTDLKVTKKPDFVISVDVASTGQLGEELSSYADKVNLVIDHHPTNLGFGIDENVIIPEAAATGEIIYDIIREMEIPITKEIANFLYIALMTDTGCFRYSNTTSKTLVVAAYLMEKGADAYNLNKYMFDTMSIAGILLRREIYKNIEFFEDGKIAAITITQQVLDETHATEDDVEAVTTIPRKIEGVLVGFAIKQIGEDVFKISARSGEEIDVSYICGTLGGGGHKRASGCTIYGTANEVKSEIIDATLKYIRDNNI